MNTKKPRNRRRDFSQDFRSTFGEIRRPKAGRKSLIALGLACVLITGAASADWRVYDDDVHKVLQEISGRIGEGDVNDNLDKLNHRFDVEGDVYDPEKDEETKTKIAEAPDWSEKATIATRRCGARKTPDVQKQVCEEIVKLEEEKYKYLQDMAKISEKRSLELKAIADERSGIPEEDFGKLQSNTNRLLALMTHQRIDDLNLQMAMATFDERIRERREALNYQGAVALNPRNSTESGSIFDQLFDSAVQVGTLEAALQVARQRDR